MSGADGKDNLSIVGKLSVLIGFRPMNRDTAPFLLKVDAALMCSAVLKNRSGGQNKRISSNALRG